MGHGTKIQTIVAFVMTKNTKPLNFRSSSRVSLKVDFGAEYFNAKANKGLINLLALVYSAIALTCINELLTIIDQLEQFFHIQNDYDNRENDNGHTSDHINGLRVFAKRFRFINCKHQIANEKQQKN